MTERWFWKLGSMWDPPPSVPVGRHEVADADAMLDRVELCRSWGADEAKWILKSSRRTRLEDFPLTAIPLLSGRAKDELEDLLRGDGEFVRLPVTCRGALLDAEYYLFNCLRKYDAIDRARTPPEAVPRRGLLPLSVDLRLSYERVPKSVNVFRCRQAPHKLLVSERVGERLIGSTLSGWMLSDPEDPPWRRASIVSPHRP